MDVLIQIISFLELCAVTIGGVNYLIAIEGGSDRRPLDSGLSLAQTYWHIWRYDPQSNKIQSLPRQTVYMSDLKALRIILDGEQILGLVENNHDFPLALVAWRDVAFKPLKFSEMPSDVNAVRLTSEQHNKVVGDSIAEWSSLKIPPTEWLFNPHISSQDSGRIILTFNAANGEAIIRAVNSDATYSKDILSLKGALEPIYFERDKHCYLFYRHAAAPYNVFYNTSRHALSAVPEELPICLAQFDESGTIKETRDLSEDAELGLSYMFDFDSDGARRLALATVAGDREKPVLSLYLSEDNGRSWFRKRRELLTGIPWRVRLTIDRNEALVGIVRMGSKSFEVSAVRVEL